MSFQADSLNKMLYTCFRILIAPSLQQIWSKFILALNLIDLIYVLVTSINWKATRSSFLTISNILARRLRMSTCCFGVDFIKELESCLNLGSCFDFIPFEASDISRTVFSWFTRAYFSISSAFFWWYRKLVSELNDIWLASMHNYSLTSSDNSS
jgi:hypothetical protein